MTRAGRAISPPPTAATPRWIRRSAVRSELSERPTPLYSTRVTWLDRPPWSSTQDDARCASYGKGLTVLKIGIANPATPDETEALDLLVDSGAVYSVVPAAILRR